MSIPPPSYPTFPVQPPLMLAVLTDLGYLIAGAFPGIASLAAPYLRWRYRDTGAAYERTVAGSADYSEPLEEALQRLTDTPDLAVDVAAGTGSASRSIRRRFPSITLVALDLSHSMLREGQGLSAGFRVVADGRQLPLATASVDLAVVQNAPAHFSELVRTVRPGGVVIFALSAAQRIPGRLRSKLIRRALPRELETRAEVRAGSGIAWVLDRAR